MSKDYGAHIIMYTPSPSRSVGLLTPYVPGFITDIKRIDYRYREWQPDMKMWVVFDDYVDHAIDLVYAWFSPVIKLYDKPQPTQTYYSTNTDGSANSNANSNNPTDYLLLNLMPTTNVALVKAAYRVLVKEVHPDTSKADGAEFIKLHAAYERILKSLGAA